MADLLSALTSSIEDTSNMTQSELIAYTFKQTQQPKIDTLNQRKQSLEQKQVFFNQLNTKITALMSAIDTFGEISGDKYNLSFDKLTNADSKFVTRNISTSDSSVITASASSEALLGVNTIKVNRLATNDVLVAQSLDLADDFALTGEHTFNMNGKAISVDFGESTLSNEEAMKKIATAINNTEDIGMSASLVKSTTTSGRLTFTATETGTTRTEDDLEVANDIRFTAGSDVLNELGLGNELGSGRANRKEYKENQADKAYYKVADPNQLNSEIVVNSVVVTRSSNTVTDALEGVTLNLHKAQDEEDMQINLTTTVGTNKVKEMLQPMLTAYNDLLGFLDENKSLQRSDASVSSLRQMVRSMPSQEISTVQTSDSDEDIPSFLTEIGLSIDNAGKIYLDDNEKLEGFLKDDPQKVADLFISEDGFAAKLNKAVYSYTGTDSIISARKDSLSQQIQTTTKRTDELQTRIDSQAEALRKEYESMLEVFLQAQAQYQMLGTYGSSDASSFYY